MGDRKSEAGSRVEALQKKPTPPPLYFSSNTPVLLTSGSLAPWLLLGPKAPTKRPSLRQVSLKELLANQWLHFRLKIFRQQGSFRIDHFQVCPRKNTNDIILRIFSLISEGISAQLSIPPN
jgi:hypothetical protein